MAQKRTLIGLDSTGAAGIKIMANSIYNPYSTPDTDYAKFLFNSKDVDQFRFAGSEDTPLYGNTAFYLPSGAGSANFTKYVNSVSSISRTYVKPGHFPGLDYALPLHDTRRVLSGWITSAVVVDRTRGYQNAAGEYASYNLLEFGWAQNVTNSNFPAIGAFQASLAYIVSATNTWPDDEGTRQTIVWNLPGDETAIKDPPLAPVAGQMTVQISKDFCRVSKPGYDVRAATRTQLAFDSTNRPVKAIYSNDLAVPTGVTSIDMTPYLYGIAVTGSLVPDVYAYQGSVLYFPTNPVTTKVRYGVQYRMNGNVLELYNPYGACRARVIVIAQDSSAPTAGSNLVWKQFNDGTQDVMQFLRPGAANPPKLADVIIDSRWPTIRILKEGTIGLSGGNGVQYVVPFDSNGLFPIVKYMTIHGGGSANSFGSFSKRVRAPFTKLIWYNAPSGGSQQGQAIAGDTTYCQLTATQATFFSYIGNPWQYEYEQTQVNPGYSLKTAGDPNPPYAIRYYILGIPA